MRELIALAYGHAGPPPQPIPDYRGFLAPPGVERPPSESPSIFAAVQEQLGLRLEARKAPIDYIVVDHADHPVED